MITDRENLKDQLEAMKMAQSNLQQLMTLSAGGLALFFSFIGKTPFVITASVVGPAVVFSWIVSLAAAAYAHRLHVDLFLLLTRVSGVHREVDSLVELADQVPLELKINPNQQGVIDRATKKIQSTRDWALSELDSFHKSFFPTQEKVRCLTRVSLGMLVFGFFELGAGYVVSVFWG